MQAQKRFFAQYVDHVQDSRDISGTSRFVSGGIGGITSQLCESNAIEAFVVVLPENSYSAIYPIETLKVANSL